MKSKYVQYYVEGECEVKLIDTLKSELRLIVPGKVQKVNPVERDITEMRIRMLSPKTMVVLIFDTDTGRKEVLDKNLELLKRCTNVTEIITIPQVRNLEDELLRCCKIKQITELLNCKSAKDFKGEFIRAKNLANTLKKHGFDINLLWNTSPPKPYQHLINHSERIKLPQ